MSIITKPSLILVDCYCYQSSFLNRLVSFRASLTTSILLYHCGSPVPQLLLHRHSHPFSSRAPSTPKMAFKALLIMGTLSSVAFAMIPPCLPYLGPDFCPFTAAAANGPKWPAASVTYPTQMHQEDMLQDLIFPLIDKDRMIVDSKFISTGANSFLPNRYCKSSFGAAIKRWLGTRAYNKVYVKATLRNLGR